jgi:chloride channel 7
MRKFRAVDVMSRPVISFNKVERVKHVVKVLRECSHNGFPVVDSNGHFVGLILRSQLAILLNEKIFIPVQTEVDFPVQDVKILKNHQTGPLTRNFITLDDFRRYYPRYPDINDVSIEKEEEEMYLDIEPCKS